MTKEQAIAINNYRISSKIMEARTSGKTLQEAFDSVLGENAYDRLVTEVYHKLRGEKI